MCLSWQTCQKLCQVHLGNDRNGGLFLSPPFRKFAKITQSSVSLKVMVNAKLRFIDHSIIGNSTQLKMDLKNSSKF